MVLKYIKIKKFKKYTSRPPRGNAQKADTYYFFEFQLFWIACEPHMLLEHKTQGGRVLISTLSG